MSPRAILPEFCCDRPNKLQERGHRVTWGYRALQVALSQHFTVRQGGTISRVLFVVEFKRSAFYNVGGRAFVRDADTTFEFVVTVK